MANLSSFAHKLKQMMRDNEETNEDLAYAIGSNTTYVSRILNERMQPPWPLLRALLKHYARRPGGLVTPEEAVIWAKKVDYDLTAEEVLGLFPNAHNVKPLFPPRPPVTFVSRPELEDQVTLALASSRPVVLVGMGGIGKTTLAATVAEKLQENFADGILWLNMMDVASTIDLCQHLCQHLGLFWLESEQQMEAGLQIWLYKRSYLVCFDDITRSQCDWLNAWLPPGGQSRFLLTTRDRQVSFQLGAVEISVGPLTELDSLRLLNGLAGQEMSHTTWASQLVERLGYLPLAIRLAGAQLRLGVNGAELLELLSAEQVDLRLLDLDEPQHRDESLILWFDVSTRFLSEDEQYLLAQLGVFTGAFDIARAAAVWRWTTVKTGQFLRRLSRFALLEHDGSGYRLHPLLRDYALMKLRQRPALENEASRRYVAWHIRHALYHPSVLDDVTDLAPELDSAWVDIVAGVKWAVMHAPELAAWAALLAHTERPALLEAIGPSLIKAVEIYLAGTTNRAEQAMLYELLGDLHLLARSVEAGLICFERAGDLWKLEEDGLASSRARLRLAGAYLLCHNQAVAAEAAQQAQRLLSQSLPLVATELETARWLFYWFEMVYNPLVRWELLPEADVASLAELAKQTNNPLLEARGTHIHRLWCTAEELIRPPEVRQRGYELTLRAYKLWRAGRRLDKADDEISWSQYLLTGRYSQRAAARFARRLSQTTPVVNAKQISLIESEGIRWWLGATENQRVGWLSRMLPRVLAANNCSRPAVLRGSRAWRWVNDILNVGILGRSGRRLTRGNSPPTGHILNGPEWQVLSSQKAIPLVGNVVGQLVTRYLSALEQELNELSAV